MELLKIYYRSSPHLEMEQVESLLLKFLQRRLAYFFSEYTLEFTKLLSTDSDNTIFEREKPEQIIIITSLTHPLLDASLLRQMIKIAHERPERIEAQGAVPGTVPNVVCQVAALKKKQLSYFAYSTLQRRYNSQLNLGRLRRLKLFRSLLTKLDHLHSMSIEEILNFFGGKEGTEFVLAYGEPVQLEYLETCPLCKSVSFSPVYADVSQPLTGFLTRFSEYYFLCHDCGLVFVNPRMPESELWRYYDRYSYDSAWTPETLKAHYEHLDHLNTSHYYNYIAALPYIQKLPVNASVIDLGGGDGEFIVFLRKQFPNFHITLWDYRILPLIEEGLTPWNIRIKQSDFLNEPFGVNSLDLITNWEVIEHLPLEKLEAYFKKIYDSLKIGGMYLFSTPDFHNPYCHALDFWAITPGEHLSVLSRKVLEPLLKRCGFRIIGEHHECVSMKTKDRWYTYGMENNAFMASRAEAMIINDFLRDETFLDSHLDWLRKRNLGSELILCCQK